MEQLSQLSLISYRDLCIKTEYKAPIWHITQKLHCRSGISSLLTTLIEYHNFNHYFCSINKNNDHNKYCLENKSKLLICYISDMSTSLGRLVVIEQTETP